MVSWGYAALAVSVALSGGSEGTDVLVLGPQIEGQAPQHLAQTLRDGVAQGLSDAGVGVSDAPDGCETPECAAEQAASGRVRAYANTVVQVTDNDYVLSVELVDAQGNAVAHTDGSCDICSFEEAGEALRGLAEQAGHALGPAARVGEIHVTSDPAGADVTLDGVIVGVTPYTQTVSEGAHTVELTHDGRRPSRQHLDVVADEVSTVDLELRRGGAVSPRTTEAIGWAAIAVGAATLISGVTLLALDETPVRSNCSAPNVDADGDCEFRYDTLGGGIGLTVAGAAVAGTGVGLVIFSRRRGSRVSGDVALTPGGFRARF